MEQNDNRDIDQALKDLEGSLGSTSISNKVCELKPLCLQKAYGLACRLRGDANHFRELPVYFVIKRVAVVVVDLNW